MEEEEVIVNTNANLPQVPENPAPVINTPAVDPDPVSDAPDTSDAEASAKCVRKLSRKISDLLEGRGSWSSAARSTSAPGMQQLSHDWTASAEECVDEYAFAAETSNAEALEPRSLKEAQSRPDWPLWEKAIEEELATLKAAGT